MPWCFLVLLLTALVGQRSYALCVHNANELQEHLAEIPAIVKEIPTTLVGDGIKIVISEAQGLLKLNGYQKIMGHWFTDDGYMTQICLEANNLKITLENKKTYDVKIDGPTRVSYKDKSLVNSQDPQYSSIVLANNGSAGSSPAGSSTTTGSSQ